MPDTQAWTSIVAALYAPLVAVAAHLPMPGITLGILGVATLVAMLNVRGGASVLVLLLGLYLLGGAWVVPNLMAGRWTP